MISPPETQTVAINIFSLNSLSKSNQAMKFSQLIAYNLRNIFQED